MAVRQYIGARYVPRFVGNYDLTQSYEALDVVDNGTGTSYIAKKPTPANTPLTNTDYWFLYGSTSGAIINLQQQIDDMNDGDVPGSLQNQINDNTLDITGLQDDIKLLKDRKFVFLGDSYYLGSASAVMTNQGWADYVIQYLGLDSNHYIKATLNDICGDPIVIATPGFSASIGTHRSFKTILESVYNRIGNVIANSVTDVVVAGGYNDIDKSDLNSGIADYASYAKQAFPNAKLWVAEIGNDGGNTRASQRYKLYSLVTPIYQYESVKNGMRYISAAERILVKPSMFDPSSPAHPTVPGYQRIGAAIANALLGGDNIFPYTSTDTLATVADSGWSINSGSIISESIRYGVKRIYSPTDIIFAPTAPQSLTTFGQIAIPIVFDGVMPTNPINRPVNVIFGDAGGYMADVQPAELSFAYSGSYQLLLVLSLFNRSNISNYTVVRIERFSFDYQTIDL